MASVNKLLFLSAIALVALQISSARSLHQRLFWQDFFNVTDFLVTTGVPSLGNPANPFGAIAVVDDPVTVSRSSDSREVGRIRGTSTVVSMDSLTSLVSVTLTLDEFQGSSLTFLSAVTNSSGQLPIATGTGEFLFAKGYALVDRIVEDINSTFSFDLRVLHF
ncbi:dirigent protein 11-like [Selaginella moellendorffii]|uniref:dirigent protein 11-like n=1 Tax=Selaginella moellendorffii TaxID=88036 RepID=UPI000D1C6CC2|nr:dirigent protein 11-like [Selaginella moellendorffii]|eukprot:XP_024541818.1 dirigent protein 11-like [Selaginella moellendorffii]